jgi:hypothetical protein
LLLQAASAQMAYLKAGLYGIAGSGKTFTASTIAIGLSQFLKSDKPIAMADTETGSDFVRPRLFEPAGKKLLVAKTRAFSDLLVIVDEAERECDILIIDSISHFHDELMDSYLKKNQLTRLRLKDWQPIKQTWREFTTRFVNSKLHVLICGRSGDVWEEKVDPDDGAVELKKVGTKMRAEREISYEPSLLIEMEAIFESNRIGSNMIRRAYVKKDRFDVIDGKHFDNPTLSDFMPHIVLLNLGGEHKALEPGRDSTAMFERNDVGARKMETREILIEKIGNEIKLMYPGQNEADKTARLKLMQEVFQTHSWTEICTRRKNEELEIGLAAIIALKGKEDTAPEADEKKSKKGGK